MRPRSRLAIAFAVSLMAALHAQSQVPRPATLSPPLRTLVESLRDTSLGRQLEGAFGLGELGPRAAPAIPFLLEVLQRYDGMTEVDPSLLKYFDERTSFMVFNGKANTINPTQIVASASLAKIGAPAVPLIKAALASADPRELYFPSLTDALANMTGPAADDLLFGLLRDSRPSARSRVASSLRLRTDPGSLDSLIATLADTAGSVRSAAAVALQRRTQQQLGEDIQKWRQWRAGQP